MSYDAKLSRGQDVDHNDVPQLVPQELRMIQ
jgi:hypothetical protein